MGRAPCCEKMGLKRGPWTTEEDQILVAYIKKHGHENWRALPKLAGLLRCGKSCRLRWINYLRPDIKRGNFTREEEDTIIMLHQKMGNRWSAIASQLPGRTDNEIKNVWHTHLKKRLTHDQPISSVTRKHRISGGVSQCDSISGTTQEVESSACTTSNSSFSPSSDMEDSHETVLPVIDDSFWSEASLDLEDSSLPLSDFSSFPDKEDMQSRLFPFESLQSTWQEDIFVRNSDNFMDFWYDLLVTAGDPIDLLEKF